MNTLPTLRRYVLWLLLVFSYLATGVLPRPLAAQSAVQSVEAVGMTVSDMDRAVAFYTGVLSFEKISDTEATGEAYERLTGVFGSNLRIVRLKLGAEQIELTEYLTPKGRVIQEDSRSNDHWFQHIAIVVSDMDKAYRHLRNHAVQHVSTSPQRIPDWNTAAAGIRAFYFRDPDGHNLEIIYFPPGKGDPRWQNLSKKLFLGIDHTAIVVSNTEKSLAFYRDLLGMRVAGESENYGLEQEHLNNVFGARLRITGLKAPSGPGIEFLEYLTPRDGRSAPADLRSNDLVHWQTTLVVPDSETLYRRIREKGYTLVSTGPVDLLEDPAGSRQGVLIRDPDGHAMFLIEKRPGT